MNLNYSRTLITLLAVLGVPAGLNGSSGAHAQAVPAAASRPVGEVWHRTELYFGTDKPVGAEVTADEFRRFMDRHVTRRFPDGLTLLPGSGQWQGADGDIVKERSFVLVLLYPRGTGNPKSRPSAPAINALSAKSRSCGSIAASVSRSKTVTEPPMSFVAGTVSSAPC